MYQVICWNYLAFLSLWLCKIGMSKAWIAHAVDISYFFNCFSLFFFQKLPLPPCNSGVQEGNCTFTARWQRSNLPHCTNLSSWSYCPKRKNRTQGKLSRIHVGDYLALGGHLAILSEVSNVKGVYTWKCPSLLLHGKNLPTKEAKLRRVEPKKCMNIFYLYLYLLLNVLKPILVALLTFTITRILTNTPFPFYYPQKVTWLHHIHTSSKWQAQDLSTGLSDSRTVVM